MEYNDSPTDPVLVETNPVAKYSGQPGDAAPSDWPAIPGYEILAELGRGGMGVVLKARQFSLDRMVAIKAILSCGPIDGDQQRRFLREAKAMALLRHPNIVQVYEIIQQGQHPFLVMEYVNGKNLSATLAGKPLPPHKAAELTAVLAKAVQAAHDQGIIHRDLKPGNVLMEADGTPRICDFGLAWHYRQTLEATQTSPGAGTPSYMAPEQVMSQSQALGPAVDVYALGAVLYECITGRTAFLADNVMDTMQMVISQEPVPPRQWQPKTPRDLETICLKCLAKDSRRRYATAQELAEDLERFLAGSPILARPVGPLERGWRWCRKHRSVAALLVVLSLAAVVVVGLTAIYNRRLSQELNRTAAANREVLASQDRLHRTLTQEVAEHLDGDLRELAVAPTTMATLLENRQEWDESHVEQTLKDMLRKNPRIFGLCAAFEPGQWQKDREDFALYVYRKNDSLAVKQLVPAGYQPLYRKWDWYLAGKNNPHGGWCEPYLGEGGDRTPMVTFAAPIRRNGQFVGVVAADLAVDYFRDLRATIDRLELGPNNYCLLVSPGGRILSHREDRYEFPGPDSDLDKLGLDPSFRRLIGQWNRDSQGTAQAVDFSTGKPATFLFYRVPSSGWILATAIR